MEICPLFAGMGGILDPATCLSCSDGMPRWSVSEPFISLSLEDTPLSYTLPTGQKMNFTFYYKQRARLPESDQSAMTFTNFVLNDNNGYGPAPAYNGGPNCGSDAFWGHNWNKNLVIQAMPGSNGRQAAPAYSAGYYAAVFNCDGTTDLYTNTDYFLKPRGVTCWNPRDQAVLTDTANQNYPNVYEWIYNQSGTFIGFTNQPSYDTNGMYWGDANIGVVLTQADGSQEIFGLSATPIAGNTYPNNGITFKPMATNCWTRLLLTQRIDPAGRATRLGYEQVTNYNSTAFRLKYVLDPDSRTNVFHYTQPYGFQVGEIDDPYGRKTTLATNSSGLLSQIVDAAGLTNTFQYQTNQYCLRGIFCASSDGSAGICGYQLAALPRNGWITQLGTPYGTTSFCHYEMDDTNVTDGVEQRAIYISEPAEANQLYCYIHNAAGLVPDTDTAPNVPGITHFDDGKTGQFHQALHYRNSFHWGRRQIAAINSGAQTSFSNALAIQISNPTNSLAAFQLGMSQLGTNDLAVARLRHWLWQGDNVSLSASLSSERAPSFDAGGQIPGLRTWYNYQNQPASEPEVLGNSPQIACVATVLPDNSTQYSTFQFFQLINGNSGLTGSSGCGLVSSNESTYTKPDGTTGLLTNWFTYAANNIDLLSTSNSLGQSVGFGYSGGHQVTSLTNGLGQVTSCYYDSYGLLQWVQLSSGELITITRNYTDGNWDPTGMFFCPGPTYLFPANVTISPSGRSFTFNSDSAGLPTSVTDDRSVTISNTWDGLNRLTGTVFPDGTSISNLYNRLDLAGTKDRLGLWTHYGYDGLQHLTAVTNANGAVTRYSYCGCGSLTEIDDAVNGTTFPTLLNYDNQGNLASLSFPDGSSLAYGRDTAGRVTNVVDGASRFQRLAYNNQGLVTNVTGANGTLESIVYDALNRPLIVTDANSVTVTNQYDAINELVRRTWPDGVSEGFGYASNGLVAYTNRDNQPTFYDRDGAGRLLGVTNANHEVTRFAYDSLGHPTDLWDGNSSRTRWQYNEYGWLTNKIDGLSRNAFAYAYDAKGRVTNRWTPEKGNTAYTYDGVGNVKSILYPQSTISYAYDALNRMTNMADALGSHTFTWTRTGQHAGENDSWTTNSWAYTQGLRTLMTNSEGWSQGYGYDSAGQLQTLTSPAGNFGYSYNFQPASALVTAIALPNGANIINSYDPLARLTGTALNNYWGHTLDGYTYAPDLLGLRTNLVRNLGLTTNSVNIGYDNIGQITSWSAKEAGGATRLNEQLAFAYDPAHNLHSRTNGGLAQTFATDAANQLAAVNRNGTFTFSGATPAPATNVWVNGQPAQVYGDFTFARTNLTLADGANPFTINATNLYHVATNSTMTVNLPQQVTLAYDNDGNLTNDGVRTFAYDWEDQLTNVFVPKQWRSDFIYDGLNRRRVELDYVWTNAAWLKTNEIHFVYDGVLLIQERDASNNVLVTYTRGLDMSGGLSGAGGIGGLLARTDTNGSTYYHTDGSGNITALMDGSENIVARYLYNPYGKLLGQWGTMAAANEMQFSSMPRHGYSGLLLYNFRVYDPNLQRFLNQDPVEEWGGINLYRYVFNSPLNYIDLDGLTPGGAAWGAAVGMGLGGFFGGTIGAAGGTLVMPGVGSLFGAGEVGAAGAAWGTGLGMAAGNAISDLLNTYTKSWHHESPNEEKTGKRGDEKNRPDGKRDRCPQEKPPEQPPKAYGEKTPNADASPYSGPPKDGLPVSQGPFEDSPSDYDWLTNPFGL